MDFSFLDAFDETFDRTAVQRFARALWGIEASFCYRDFARSARFCADALRGAGARGVRCIPIAADGRTASGDFVMPQAWDVDAARLEIAARPDAPAEALADLRESRFAVANRCGPTPRAGVEGPVVHVENPARMPGVAGAFVFVDTLYPAAVRERAVRGGALGIVSAFTPAPDAPDGTYWINGWGAGPGWYQTAEEAPLPCFSITPARGLRLRRLLASGVPVRLRARVASRLYDGAVHNITGLIPGRRAEEIVLIAHIYEPLLTDNAVSAAALVELCRTVTALAAAGRLPPLERGIRFLFTMERYGTAHYFATPRPEVVAAVNVDSIAPDPCKTGALALRLKRSPYSLPFAGEYLFDAVLQAVLPENLPVRAERPDFADDTIVSGPGIRIPSVYLSSSPGKRHHHSEDPAMVNWEVAHAVTRTLAAYAWILASADAGAAAARSMPPRLKEETAAVIRRLGEALEAGAAVPRAAAADFVRRHAAAKIASLTRLGAPPLSGRRGLLAWVGREAARLERPPDRSQAAAVPSAAERLAANLVPGPVPVYPFCLRRIPRDRRGAVPAEAGAALNRADGKRDLAAILADVDCERLLFRQPVLTEGEKREMERLERRGGKVVLIGAGYANTFHHVVETTRGAPCLGRRTEAYPVRLPSGRQVVCRTWGWREGCCPVTDKGVYWEMLRDRGLVRVTTVGPAEALCVTMRDCRRVIARYLDGKVTGCGGCRTCGVRPRRVAQTVASDWDDCRQRVAAETDAFTGEWTGET